ncbi:uncharacterized protein LOC124914133 isoform X1 [Impatiens glandulifera]|uniref:uncharacterized protein LOC124914133 isoform X1 n=1 Tax=Impatiens glandulifera TaxID=253017 RepID=UPI001FB0F90F|nr:uncharacterized protein LOC124914133 isoform X1 [Impatiens glandulifera]
MRFLKRQSWRISIHVRTKYLDLILKTSRSFQSWNWKSSPLSLKIKLALKLCPKKSCLSILRNFTFRHSSKKCLDFTRISNSITTFAQKERIWVGLILIGLLSLMFESNSYLIVIFRFMVYLYSVFVFKKYISARTWNGLVVYSIMGVFSWIILVYLSKWKSLLNPIQMMLIEFIRNSLKETLNLLFDRFKLSYLL